MREMKESGAKWIGKIPKDWEAKRLKNVLNERKENNNPVKTDNILSLTNDRGVIPYSEKGNQGNKAKDDLTGYKLAYPNDIVMNSMNVVIGSVGLSKYYGCVSPVYYMLYSNKYDIRYYNYIFQSKVFQNELKGLGNGILEIRMRIPMEKMNNVILPIPPINEQQRIANFLDKKVIEIDNVIEKTKETIEYYKKYKQSIITETIDKGLKKNKSKSNQKSWKKTKIKYLADINPKNEKEICEDDEVTYTPMEYIKNGYYIQNTGLWKNNTSSYNTYLENDIVMAKVTPCFENGNIAIMKNLVNGIGYGSSELIVFRCKKSIKNKYLLYLLQSEVLKKLCISTMTGTGGLKRVSIDFIKNYVCYIPEKKEQEKIINYLDLKCSEIEKLIQSKENLIIELEKYKNSLIYEFVTGKKEVKSNKSINKNNSKGIKINCKDNIFAQAILLCKIIEKLNDHNLGRVKAEKTLYLIEKDIGFDFNNDYVREAAGPLSESIYKCESVISKKNKWIKVNKVKRHIEYEILSQFSKYNQYYEKYYSGYDKQIENIIGIIKDYSTDKAEMVATLYASWNDFIIKKETISDLEIVKDVRENWNDTKKRFDEKKWLVVLEEMKQIGLTPKGNGNLTIIKEQ